MLNAIKKKDKDKDREKKSKDKHGKLNSNNISNNDINTSTNINSYSRISSSSTLNRQNTIKIKNKKKHFNQFNFNSLNDNLFQKIIDKDDSNKRCCDCNSLNNVDWISTNLLCILCIKCSGIHRSMGSHISKIKSIKYDNFDNNLELIYLLENFISNKLINDIYESKLKLLEKITPNVDDSVRLKFINDKYFLKKFVSHKSNDLNKLLSHLTFSMENKDIFKLIRLIAQSEISLKNLSIKFNSNLLIDSEVNTMKSKEMNDENFDINDPNILQKIDIKDINNNNVTNFTNHHYPETIFQKSLKHYTLINNKHTFFITEFLLNNDMVIDNDFDNFKLLHNLVKDNFYMDDKTNLIDDTKTYWQLKFDTFGTYKTNSKSDPSLNNNNNNLGTHNSHSDSLKDIRNDTKLNNLSQKDKKTIQSYGTTKNDSFLSSTSTTTTSSSTNNTDKTLNDRNKRKSSNKKRWSLSYIHKTSQNIITMHKSLKNVKHDK